MRGVGVHLKGRHGLGVVCTEANKGLKATTVHIAHASPPAIVLFQRAA